MDVAGARRLGERLAVEAGVVEGGAMEDHLGAHAAHGRHLAGVGTLRHHDLRPHTEEPRGVGHRLAVVACGGGQYAAGPLLSAELRDQVDAAAHLEGAHGLVVLVLHISRRADQIVQRRVAVQRGAPQVRGDLALGQQNIAEGGELHTNLALLIHHSATENEETRREREAVPLSRAFKLSA